LIPCKGKGSPYSIAECRVPDLIKVLGSQPVGDVSHKPDGRLPLLSARPAVIHTTLRRAATKLSETGRQVHDIARVSPGLAGATRSKRVISSADSL